MNHQNKIEEKIKRNRVFSWIYPIVGLIVYFLFAPRSSISGLSYSGGVLFFNIQYFMAVLYSIHISITSPIIKKLGGFIKYAFKSFLFVFIIVGIFALPFTLIGVLFELVILSIIVLVSALVLWLIKRFL